MHYYPFNIGDYARRTQHLSLMEDLAYRRLLDLYYLDEQTFNDRSTDVLSREIGMREQSDDVEYILAKFFPNGVNKGADEVLGEYRKKKKQQSSAGKASAKARQLKASERMSNGRSTDVQPTNNQEPITKNQEPERERKEGAPTEDEISPFGELQTITSVMAFNGFKPPTEDVVSAFAANENLNLNNFFNHYQANGWMIGANPMQDWRARAKGWSATENKRQSPDGINFDSVGWSQ